MEKKILPLLEKHPIALTSINLQFEDYSDLEIFQKNNIGLLEVTPIIPNNKAWTVGDPESTRSFLGLCRRHRVQPDSVHCFFYANLGHDMVDPDPQIRKKAIELNLTLFHAAREIGARYVVFHLDNEKQARSDDEIMTLAREAVLALLPGAEKTGIGIAIENLRKEWSISKINQLLDDLNHPLLGICFDTGHSALYNSVDQELELCGNRLLGLHIHDNNLEQDEHLAPFRGKIDWRSVASVLIKINYDGPLMIEAFNRKKNESREHFIRECQIAYTKLLGFMLDYS